MTENQEPKINFIPDEVTPGIRTSAQTNNIFKALFDATANLSAVKKSGFNNFQKYTYATLDDYLGTIGEKLSENNLLVVSGVEYVKRLPERKNAKGNTEHAVQVCLVQRIIHISGEWIEIKMYGDGQDNLDKAVYKAITGARKYAYACQLSLVTTDDPEKDEEEKPRKQNKIEPVKNQPPQAQEMQSQKATPSQIRIVTTLLQRLPDSKALQDKWLSAAKINSFSEMTQEQIAKCIEKIQELQEKIAKNAA